MDLDKRINRVLFVPNFSLKTGIVHRLSWEPCSEHQVCVPVPLLPILTCVNIDKSQITEGNLEVTYSKLLIIKETSLVETKTRVGHFLH